MSNATGNKDLLGFGFVPAQSEHHFVVVIPRSPKQEIMVHELQQYDPDMTIEGLQMNYVGPAYSGKVRINQARWNLLERYLKSEFNQRLRDSGATQKSINWKKGINYVHRLFGKELMVLLWAMEEADPHRAPQAIENWLGLRPEERWWLYTITNAATGHPENGRGRGWRKALRFALTENPIPEGTYTQGLLDKEKLMLFEEENEYPAKK